MALTFLLKKFTFLMTLWQVDEHKCITHNSFLLLDNCVCFVYVEWFRLPLQIFCVAVAGVFVTEVPSLLPALSPIAAGSGKLASQEEFHTLHHIDEDGRKHAMACYSGGQQCYSPLAFI
ncbi:hypothetical protein HS088_TW01G00476 [Tripterygium wilfordii]|uniref:Uncharacterized protein n=1 Tax=Tripterygium wilfordii TaxID=458696 RepID=A0A7J7E201_TRIWF|nr:hypothetical protein HS088_TW01G00476 [Tripterygium wilfordii]